ncbi:MULTISPECIES: hypothetical protein [Enterobacter]|uniref:hypothetical protein n=1 Tax=Enterobacter TaxID=547 RepID=UPI001CBD569A|nr:MULTISPECIES: hypothetical protein [Enterobacter]UAN18821.1 hypothetical protein KGP20_24360 [Enterobacter asburiae]UAN34151.1 hypothetical protein KGP22_22245 [Enterobacter sp. JBIWA005]
MDSATAAGSGGQISGRSDGRMTGMPVQLATVPLRKMSAGGLQAWEILRRQPDFS